MEYFISSTLKFVSRLHTTFRKWKVVLKIDDNFSGNARAFVLATIFATFYNLVGYYPFYSTGKCFSKKSYTNSKFFIGSICPPSNIICSLKCLNFLFFNLSIIWFDIDVAGHWSSFLPDKIKIGPFMFST